MGNKFWTCGAGIVFGIDGWPVEFSGPSATATRPPAPGVLIRALLRGLYQDHWFWKLPYKGSFKQGSGQVLALTLWGVSPKIRSPQRGPIYYDPDHRDSSKGTFLFLETPICTQTPKATPPCGHARALLRQVIPVPKAAKSPQLRNTLRL